MKPGAVTILDSELLCSLGGREQRLAHLRRGSSRVLRKSLEVNGERYDYPYFLLREEEKSAEKEAVLELLVQVVEPLLERSGLDSAGRSRCGLLLGSSSNDFSLAMPLGRTPPGALAAVLPRQRIGNGYCADVLRQRFGLGGIELTYNTACTSSANALLDAASLLRLGLLDHALVIGLELFTPVTLDGFASLQLLTRKAIRPFDRDRDGFVLGETVNALLLSRAEPAPDSWTFLGGASNCATFSITGVNPDGSELAEVMERALQAAGLAADGIDAIKAHGTAGEQSDAAETNGMKRVFPGMPPFLALKPYLGHTLGACATAELILFMEAVEAGFLPPSINFCTRDEALGLHPLQRHLPCRQGRFLMNYFGFGGNNTSFIVSKGKR